MVLRTKREVIAYTLGLTDQRLLDEWEYGVNPLFCGTDKDKYGMTCPTLTARAHYHGGIKESDPFYYEGADRVAKCMPKDTPNMYYRSGENTSRNAQWIRENLESFAKAQVTACKIHGRDVRKHWAYKIQA